MTRRPWLAAALLALAGCPLPQALPETVAAGSGGFGPPSEREAAAIARDLEDGYVTPEGVRRDYGR